MIKRAAFVAVTCLGLGLWSSQAHAQEDFSYQIGNLTLSGGDPTFPVVTDVTFQNLVLKESFDGVTTVDVPLSSTSLNTATILLNSPTVAQSVLGPIKFAELTGNIDSSSLDIRTSFGGSINTVVVDPSFDLKLVGNPFMVGDYGVITVADANGATYGIGTLGISSVPEPSAMLLPASLGVGMALLGLRRRRRA